VFFDALDIKWHYEPEGYETSAGWYLPDFYLPDEEMWVEVKGAPAMRSDLLRVQAFGHLVVPIPKLSPQVIILTGDIPREVPIPYDRFDPYDAEELSRLAMRHPYGKYEFCHHDVNSSGLEFWLNDCFYFLDDVNDALTEARSARFDEE
jgi:hypothetical protein